jgi:hypothetical protein
MLPVNSGRLLSAAGTQWHGTGRFISAAKCRGMGEGGKHLFCDSARVYVFLARTCLKAVYLILRQNDFFFARAYVFVHCICLRAVCLILRQNDFFPHVCIHMYIVYVFLAL